MDTLTTSTDAIHMSTVDIQDDYFNYLVSLVATPDRDLSLNTLKILDNIPFYYSIENDLNRYNDGIDMRNRYISDKGIEPHKIRYISDRPCSVFEMMVALAVRIETEIMGDPNVGDQTYKWFYTMLESMDISHISDFDYGANFKRYYNETMSAAHIMMDRNYEFDGSGGALFVIKTPRNDMRVTEIWYQAMWFLTENYF